VGISRSQNVIPKGEVQAKVGLVVAMMDAVMNWADKSPAESA